ncbi:MAG: polysaccharide deacetylase family protein [Candidatus Omnitrophica bacterium]|nr:polysaccharide deacetylase family protein [Candidatus Omnitrophota bacterium]
MWRRYKWFIILTAIGMIAVALFTAHHFLSPKKPVVDPAKRAFVLTSLHESQRLTQQGIAYIQQKEVVRAVDSFREAINVFPPNNQAYEFLLKIYLATGDEQKVYETLEAAGRSYPAFDQILKAVDDASLARIPMSKTEDVYIAPFRENKKTAISFMFDDGETSVYSDVMPIFDQFAYKATVSVIPSQVAAHSGDPFRGSWAQWKDAADRGFEIANHSMNHLDARKLTPDQYKTEIDDAKALIEKNTGKRVSSYVFPLDSFSEPVLRHVLQSHTAARDPAFLRLAYNMTMDIMYGGPSFSVDSANRLVDIAINRHLWLISECHGLDIHSKKSYKPLTKDFVSTHLAYIKARQDDIWVDTFSAVANYLMIRKGTQVARKDIADGRAQVVLTSGVGMNDFAVPLTVVLKVKPAAPGNISATTADGKSLKAWNCGDAQICVDVSVVGQPVNITWGQAGQ